MTQKEAECYLVMKKWQRVHLRHQMWESFIPKFPFSRMFAACGWLGKITILLCNSVVLPFTLIWWCFRILKGLIFYPICISLSHLKPKNLRGPGERNIKGIHYQFASHAELPIELYIACVNEWTSILYGQDKLPGHKLENYLDTDYLDRRNSLQDAEPIVEQILKTQISNAREELSRDLGHY